MSTVMHILQKALQASATTMIRFIRIFLFCLLGNYSSRPHKPANISATTCAKIAKLTLTYYAAITLQCTIFTIKIILLRYSLHLLQMYKSFNYTSLVCFLNNSPYRNYKTQQILRQRWAPKLREPVLVHGSLVLELEMRELQAPQTESARRKIESLFLFRICYNKIGANMGKLSDSYHLKYC